MSITIDNEELNKSTSQLAAFESANRATEIKGSDLMPFQKALADEFGKMKDCEDMIAQAEPQIAALQAALTRWQNFKAYQERRLPGLRRRYHAARDYIRAAEDEQTGNL